MGIDGFFDNIEDYDLVKIINKFTLRPADQVHYIGLLSRPDFIRALFTPLTQKFEADMKYALEGEQCFDYQINGDRGTGKSTVAYTIGVMTGKPFQMFYTKEAILDHLGLITEETQQNQAFTGYFTYILDEPLFTSGDSTDTIAGDYKNINQMCRQFNKNFVHNTPFWYKTTNINIYLETFGVSKETQENRLLWINKKTGKYDGYVIFKKNFTNAEFNLTNEQKKAQWQNLIDNEGSLKAINMPHLLLKILEKIHAKKLESELERPSDINFYLTTVPHVTTEMRKLLMPKIMKALNAEAPHEKEKEFTADQFELRATESIQPDNFDPMIEALPFTEKDQGVIALLIVEGLKIQQAIQHFNDNKFKDSRFKKDFDLTRWYKGKANSVGVCMENRYAEIHPELEHQGGYAKPDFFDNTKKWVIAFKAVLPAEGIKKQLIDCATEWQEAKSRKWELWVFVCCFRNREVYHYQYTGGFE